MPSWVWLAAVVRVPEILALTAGIPATMWLHRRGDVKAARCLGGAVALSMLGVALFMLHYGLFLYYASARLDGMSMRTDLLFIGGRTGVFAVAQVLFLMAVFGWRQPLKVGDGA